MSLWIPDIGGWYLRDSVGNIEWLSPDFDVTECILYRESIVKIAAPFAQSSLPAQSIRLVEVDPNNTYDPGCKIWLKIETANLSLLSPHRSTTRVYFSRPPCMSFYSDGLRFYYGGTSRDAPILDMILPRLIVDLDLATKLREKAGAAWKF